jgi:hypothetical protein
MIRKLKSALPVFLVLFMAVSAMGQSKPGCEPQSCGPGNTKVSEAKVITDLRNELQGVITLMSKSSVGFSKAVTTFEIASGESDDESVLILSQTASFIRAELMAKLTPHTLIPELKDFKPTPATSKQQILINLKSEVKVLVMQVSKVTQI